MPVKDHLDGQVRMTSPRPATTLGTSSDAAGLGLLCSVLSKLLEVEDYCPSLLGGRRASCLAMHMAV